MLLCLSVSCSDAGVCQSDWCVCVCVLQLDMNDMPRRGMPYERAIIVLANPYCDEPGRKFSAVEVVLPQTGTVKFLCKLPQPLFMPGKCCQRRRLVNSTTYTTQRCREIDRPYACPALQLYLPQWPH